MSFRNPRYTTSGNSPTQMVWWFSIKPRAGQVEEGCMDFLWDVLEASASLVWSLLTNPKVLLALLFITAFATYMAYAT